MTKEKTLSVLSAIKTTYFYAYKDFTKQQFLQLCDIWYECLKPFSDEQVATAIKIALMEQSTPPVPSDIIKYIKRAIFLDKPSDVECWSILMSAVEKIKKTYVKEEGCFMCLKALYELKDKTRCKEIYDKLPNEIQKTIDFSTFVFYASLDEKALSIERNRFLKAIPEKREMDFQKEVSVGRKFLYLEKQLKLGDGEND